LAALDVFRLPDAHSIAGKELSGSCSGRPEGEHDATLAPGAIASAVTEGNVGGGANCDRFTARPVSTGLR